MIQIIFASQTGTSQDVAFELAQTFKQRSMNSIITSIDKITLKQLKQFEYTIFLISTTGDGQPVDTMVDIWNQLLDKSLSKEFLKLKYSVFGFGDSKYKDSFNDMARKLERRLVMLGGKIISERGLGDEQDMMGYRNEYNVWIKGLLDVLESEESIVKSESATYLCNNHTIETKLMTVDNISMLHQEEDRTTYYVEFKTEIVNQPGDILTIFPKNKEADVEQMLNYFNLSKNQIVQKQNFKLPAYEMFKEIINISDTAPFTLFSHLDKYIEDQFLKNKLRQMGQSYLQYHLYVKQYRRSIIEVLEDFPVKMELSYFLQKINFLKPRKYSVASCKKGTISLLVRLIQKNATAYRKIFGLVSKGILDQGINSNWRGYVTKGKFNFEKNTSYFMVSVGTGLAPFLSFFDHQNRAHSKLYLNFGNRNQKQFYRKQYLESKINEGNLIVKLAYSRIKVSPIHVQQLFKLHKQEILKFFDYTKTKIYICGPYSNFAESIIIALQKALQIDSETISQMKKNNQIVSECW